MDLANRVELSLSGPLRRTLPNAPEAEATVIGGVLLAPVAFVEAAALVAPADFYHPTHAAIWQAMVDLDAAGKPIDAITIAERMKAADTYGRLRAMNGEAYFAELMSNVVTVENIAFHARAVAGKARVRALIATTQEIAARGYGDHGDPDELIADAEAAIYAIGAQQAGQGYQSARAGMSAVVKRIEAAYERQSAVTGIPTGIRNLDVMTGGWQPSTLNVIMARPSMGKSALMLDGCLHAGLQHGIPCLVFSLEMSREALLARGICAESRISSDRMRAGQLTQRDWVALTRAASLVAGAPLWIDDEGSPTLAMIRAKARRWRSRADEGGGHPDGHALVCVDYLQLARADAPTRGGNREQEIAEISRGLKALAKELRLPVVALAQLNRACEARADKRPQLSDLRESGQIEQDADVVAAIYRDEVYNADSRDRGTAEIIIRKQREGACGTVRAAFLAEYTRFENLADRDDLPPPRPTGRDHYTDTEEG